MEELYEKMKDFIMKSDKKLIESDRHYKELVISLESAMYHAGVCLGKQPAVY